MIQIRLTPKNSRFKLLRKLENKINNLFPRDKAREVSNEW
jgi:hypothetical protein